MPSRRPLGAEEGCWHVLATETRSAGPRSIARMAAGRGCRPEVTRLSAPIPEKSRNPFGYSIQAILLLVEFVISFFGRLLTET